VTALGSTSPPAPPTFFDLGLLFREHPRLRVERDTYNINVTSELGTRIDAQAAIHHIQRHSGSGKPAHLYFHVPLCAYICHFCNYVKRVLPEGAHGEEAVVRWTDLLLEESRRYLNAIPWYSTALIQSIYFGGGTASILGVTSIARLLKHITANYTVSSSCEVTLEGNPDNFQGDEVGHLVSVGVNRFSIGVQSLQDEVNRFTGRGHDSVMSLRAIENLANAGKPFNVDFMFGLPFQTPASVGDDINNLVRLGVPTITIYRLRNADRERMGIGVKALWNVESVRDKLTAQGVFPSLEDTYRMRNEAVAKLLAGGYYPSPCGWWSLPGTYGEPNIPQVSRNKWQQYDSMIAYGPGAYGWCSGESSELLQTHNSTSIAGHASSLETSSGLPLSSGRILNGVAAVATVLGFGFKACQPIPLERYRRQFGVDLLSDAPYADIIAEMLSSGFLELTKDRQFLLPTLIGEALHEEVISFYFHQKLGGADVLSCKKAAIC
jgi:anaerobilin synthase